jgi:hypothetical protein
VDYENKTDDWFAANERVRIGLPFSPWFDYWWWANPIEGGGHTHFQPVSLSTGVLIAGLLCLKHARRRKVDTPDGGEPREHRDQTGTP